VGLGFLCQEEHWLVQVSTEAKIRLVKDQKLEGQSFLIVGVDNTAKKELSLLKSARAHGHTRHLAIFFLSVVC
jgi:hypothetical protein